MIVRLSDEYRKIKGLIEPWLDEQYRDEEGVPVLQTDAPKDIIEIYPRYRELTKEYLDIIRIFRKK